VTVRLPVRAQATMAIPPPQAALPAHAELRR
jgi:hypothetical protein